MATDNKKREELIELRAAVEKGIISAEKDYSYPSQAKELREFVFNVHAEVEWSIELILMVYLFNAAHGKKPSEKNIDDNFVPFIKGLGRITSGDGFTKKLDQAKDFLSMETKSGSLYQNIKKLNEIRIEFAHPRRGRFKKYSNIDEQIRAYKVINNVLEFLPELQKYYGL